jgi:hypothetical protein
MVTRVSPSNVFCFALAALSAIPAAGADNISPVRRALELAPIRFERSAPSEFFARGLNYRLALSPRGAVLALPDHQVRLSLVGASSSATIDGEQPLTARVNYFHGSDRSKWRTGVPNFGRVRCAGVYPGVDVIYYGNGHHLEYDFVVQPGANPEQIRMKFSGVDDLGVDEHGDLVLRLGDKTLVQRKPVVYQGDGASTAVDGSYRLAANSEVRFVVGPYDRTRPLVVDPTFEFTSYVGGNGGDIVTQVAKDPGGYIYVAGYTKMASLSNLSDVVQRAFNGDKEIFIVKMTPLVADPVENIVFAAYIGGAGADVPKALEVDADGNMYLTGSTSSSDFPTAGNPGQSELSGTTDAFLVKYSAVDGLAYSTYLGGTNALVLGPDGKIYVAGETYSGDFPLTGDSSQPVSAGQREGFLAVYDTGTDGSITKSYATFFGGGDSDTIRSIALDPDGSVLLAGFTTSASFPWAGSPVSTEYAGAGDAFVAKIDPREPAATSEIYATFLGGSGLDDVSKILVDQTGKVVLIGYTLSTDFPVTPDALQSSNEGNADIFVCRLDLSQIGAAGLLYSTYLGGKSADVAYGAGIDDQNTLYLTGYTLSTNFPVTPSAYLGGLVGLYDAFITRIDLTKPPEEALLYSTYFGSSGLDVGYALHIEADGVLTLAGITTSQAFPVGNPTQRNQPSGLYGAFVVVFDPKP